MEQFSQSRADFTYPQSIRSEIQLAATI